MFLVCIIITNILLGLTVSKTDYFMKKADIIRLENTAIECQRWSNIKTSNWNMFFDASRHKVLKQNIKITISLMTSNSNCSGVLYVTKPFRTFYYWITKKFVEAQG